MRRFEIPNRVRGFTLIELIVVVSIILMVSGVAIATYTRSQSRQSVFNEAREISDLVQSAQRMVLAGQKPQGCLLSTLERYQLRVINNSTVELWAICNGSDSLVQSVELGSALITAPSVAYPATAGTIDFAILTGGVTPTTISICGSGYQFDISIGGAGSISAPTYAGSC